jgi:hypothetical protein
MSLTQTKIDANSARTLTFVRFSVSYDSSGNGTVTVTEITTETGDIQPWSQDMKMAEREGSSIENVDNITHIAFVKNRVSGVKQKDYIKDTDDKLYQIVFIADWYNSPQEFDLRVVTDVDV